MLNNINRFPHLQGQIQFDTRYKEVPRDQKGRFTQPENATRVDMAPVRPKQKSCSKGKNKISALEIAELYALLNLRDTDDDQPLAKRQQRAGDISIIPPPPTGPQGPSTSQAWPNSGMTLTLSNSPPPPSPPSANIPPTQNTSTVVATKAQRTPPQPNTPPQNRNGKYISKHLPIAPNRLRRSSRLPKSKHLTRYGSVQYSINP